MFLMVHWCASSVIVLFFSSECCCYVATQRPPGVLLWVIMFNHSILYPTHQLGLWIICRELKTPIVHQPPSPPGAQSNMHAQKLDILCITLHREIVMILTSKLLKLNVY